MIGITILLLVSHVLHYVIFLFAILQLFAIFSATSLWSDIFLCNYIYGFVPSEKYEGIIFSISI